MKPTQDRPPLFEACNIENLKSFDNEQELKELGVLNAIGNMYTRKSNFDLLLKARRIKKGVKAHLTLNEEDKLSRIITRLTDLWVKWTDDERERFYYYYLIPSEQPNTQRVISKLHTQDHVSIPKGMIKMIKKGWTAHLYQARAVNFALCCERVVLALEMGLGKTLCALMIFHILKARKAIKQAIVTAPKSCHESWFKHLNELSDATHEITTDYNASKRENAYTKFYYEHIEILVITPQALSNDYRYFNQIMRDKKDVMIFADEVHKYKSRDSGMGRAFESISKGACRVVGLTGTPKPNKVQDFYTIIDRVAPQSLGTYQDFVSEYTYRTYDQYSSVQGVKYEAGALRADKLQELYKRLEKVLFVRTAIDHDVMLNLPPRLDLAPRLFMDDLQRSIAKGLVSAQAERELNSTQRQKALRGELDKIALYCAEGATATAQALGIRIEQTAITPAIYSESFKLDYPFYESPKIRFIADSVTSHCETGGSCVVFCEYIQGLENMRESLLRRGIKEHEIDVYTGATSEKKRREITARLNEGRSKVLLGQTKALETGANLQEKADFVAHLSTPWSPDTLTQSTARVYRQGQQNKVTVLRPSGNALEEAKNKALTKKIMQSAGLTGSLYDSDKAVISTASDPRIRKAQDKLLKRGSYSYAIIKDLLDLKG
jgi:SNF2 family DNA or RNA helicase